MKKQLKMLKDFSYGNGSIEYIMYASCRFFREKAPGFSVDSFDIPLNYGLSSEFFKFVILRLL